MNSWHLPVGFRYAGIVSGLRSEPNRLDLALVVSDRPAQAAGVFTQNIFCAAPVQICKDRLPRADARGIVICSGNANACTGEQGLLDARRMAELLALQLNCPEEQILIGSTGVIGRLLPMAIMEKGIPKAFRELAGNKESLEHAAKAILTTDTRIKVTSLDLPNPSGEPYHIMGFAKGAAMIGPNMATMLGFLFTDAPVEANTLQTILRHAVDRSFNCISVEGHTSTNDTVLILANGEGPALSGKVLERFREAVEKICATLAMEIASDAEGANHLVKIEVSGCRTDAEARKIAKTIAESALVKSAIYGADPNWGRFVSAAGYAGVPFQETELTLWMGDMMLFREGRPLPFDAATASGYLKHNREVSLKLQFTLGSGGCTFYTCDLTPEYIRLNADYTT